MRVQHNFIESLLLVLHLLSVLLCILLHIHDQVPTGLGHVVGGVYDEACPVGQVGVSWGLAALLLELEGCLRHLTQGYSHHLG